jgi:hypothetical protein
MLGPVQGGLEMLIDARVIGAKGDAKALERTRQILAWKTCPMRA